MSDPTTKPIVIPSTYFSTHTFFLYKRERQSGYREKHRKIHNLLTVYVRVEIVFVILMKKQKI